MGNCLVTKLKGVVNNDNLPIIGQTTLRMKQTSSDQQELIIMRTNSLGSVGISSPDGGRVEISYGSNPTPASSQLTGWLRKGEGTLTSFVFDSSYNIFDFSKIGYIEDAKGLSSMLCFLKAIEATYCSATFIRKFFNEMARQSHLEKVVFLESETPGFDIVQEAIQANKATLKQFGEQSTPCSAFSDSQLLQYFSGTGNIEDLPVTIRRFESQGINSIQGNVSTYVQKCIATGRTTGTIWFSTWPASQGVTISIDGNVVPLWSYMQSIGLDQNATVYISWDAQGQITLSQGSAPADYVAPDPITP